MSGSRNVLQYKPETRLYGLQGYSTNSGCGETKKAATNKNISIVHPPCRCLPNMSSISACVDLSVKSARLMMKPSILAKPVIKLSPAFIWR